jgi:hypothetical protein
MKDRTQTKAITKARLQLEKLPRGVMFVRKVPPDGKSAKFLFYRIKIRR